MLDATRTARNNHLSLLCELPQYSPAPASSPSSPTTTIRNSRWLPPPITRTTARAIIPLRRLATVPASNYSRTPLHASALATPPTRTWLIRATKSAPPSDAALLHHPQRLPHKHVRVALHGLCELGPPIGTLPTPQPVHHPRPLIPSSA